MKATEYLFKGLLVFCLLGGVAGCAAVGRETLDLASIHGDAVQLRARPHSPRVVISVSDKRVFKVSPSDPSLPSVGCEDTAQARSCLIARKRNGWGMALGDIISKDGYRVTEYVGKLVKEAFVGAGYAVAGNGESSVGAIPVDVGIEQFWGWQWSASVNVRMELDVRIGTGAGREAIPLLVESSVKCMLPTTSKWVAVFSGNADDVVRELTAKINVAKPIGRKNQKL